MLLELLLSLTITMVDVQVRHLNKEICQYEIFYQPFPKEFYFENA